MRGDFSLLKQVDKISREFVRGLEQAGDSVMPDVIFVRSLKSALTLTSEPGRQVWGKEIILKDGQATTTGDGPASDTDAENGQAKPTGFAPASSPSSLQSQSQAQEQEQAQSQDQDQDQAQDKDQDQDQDLAQSPAQSDLQRHSPSPSQPRSSPNEDYDLKLIAHPHASTSLVTALLHYRKQHHAKLEQHAAAAKLKQRPELHQDPSGLDVEAPGSHLRLRGSNMRVLIAIGPEGGWVDDELGMFDEQGFTRVSMGPRIMSTTTALTSLVSAGNSGFPKVEPKVEDVSTDSDSVMIQKKVPGRKRRAPQPSMVSEEPSNGRESACIYVLCTVYHWCTPARTLPALRPKPQPTSTLALIPTSQIICFPIPTGASADSLQVQKRRIYDITNVLEGVGEVEKKGKNNIQFAGGEALIEQAENKRQYEATTALLLEQERQVDEQIRQLTSTMEAFLEEKGKYLFVTDQDIMSVPCFSNEHVIAVKAPQDTILQGPEVDGNDGGEKHYKMRLRSLAGPMSPYIDASADLKTRDLANLVKGTSNFSAVQTSLKNLLSKQLTEAESSAQARSYLESYQYSQQLPHSMLQDLSQLTEAESSAQARSFLESYQYSQQLPHSTLQDISQHQQTASGGSNLVPVRSHGGSPLRRPAAVGASWRHMASTGDIAHPHSARMAMSPSFRGSSPQAPSTFFGMAPNTAPSTLGLGGLLSPHGIHRMWCSSPRACMGGEGGEEMDPDVWFKDLNSSPGIPLQDFFKDD
eukprot:gene5978-5269_t